MNKIYFLGLILILVSCKQNELSSEFEKRIDSLTTELNNSKEQIESLKSELNDKSEMSLRNEKFDSFFWRFMTDSSFQSSRIKFPLEYITWKDEIDGEIDSNKIKKSEWEYDSFYINRASERTQIYDNFNLNLRPTNERVLHSYGVETGGDAKYYFTGFDGKWHLIRKEQLGD